MHFRLPPPARQTKREPVRQQRERAVAQLRELERRAKAHKPVDDIPTPHIAADGEERKWRTDKERVNETIAKFRDMQKREREAMPLFRITQDQQWKLMFGKS